MEEVCHFGSYEEFSEGLMSEDLFDDINDYETQRFGSVSYVTKDFLLKDRFVQPLDLQ